jgi:hypothetical protein
VIIAEFVSDRIALTVLTGGRTLVIVPNAHKPTENYSTGCFWGELRQAAVTT